MSAENSANQQSNIEAQVVIGPPFLPVLHKGQKINSVRMIIETFT